MQLLYSSYGFCLKGRTLHAGAPLLLSSAATLPAVCYSSVHYIIYRLPEPSLHLGSRVIGDSYVVRQELTIKHRFSKAEERKMSVL